MNTYNVKKEEVKKKWYLIDAKDKILGRVASRVASILRGKHKPCFTPHVDMGDHVIVINANKIKVTGMKTHKKVYYRHSGYPGGLKQTVFKDMIKKDPTFPLKNAVKGMLPHNRLGRKQLKHLKVYTGEIHPHQAQKPDRLDI